LQSATAVRTTRILTTVFIVTAPVYIAVALLVYGLAI
jgi:hypothetical protein